MSAAPRLDSGFAEALRGAKRDIVLAGIDGCAIAQHGGVYIAGPSEVVEWPALPVVQEPVIETFVTAPGEPAAATSAHQPFVDLWRPLVDLVSNRVFAETDRYAIELDGPVYVTVSATPCDLVSDNPHLDDDQYYPDDGVGLVAIVGEFAGPRLVAEPLRHRPLDRPTQLQFDDATLEHFARGEIAQQSFEPNRIVVFAQFGQLHCGPTLPADHSATQRSLLVLRAKTRPRRKMGRGV